MPRWLFAGAVLFALPLAAVTSPQDVRLPPLEPRKRPAPALFSHWRHAEQQCFNCHPAVFAQQRFGFTHAQMKEGRYCAACHDGKRGKAISAMTCESCHAP